MSTCAPLGTQDTFSGTALYVHVPFCALKCHYCDFYSFAAEPRDARDFVDLILLEAKQRAPNDPQTVFVGGGTPSWLSLSDLARLFDGLDKITGARNSASEITVECNPESLDYNTAELLLSLGVTRLSIGVQSLRHDLLQSFGRIHGPLDAHRAFSVAIAAGFEDVNIDLIYAAPGQVLREWEEDLRQVIAWGPSHVSAYLLAFETGTAFGRWQAEGRLRQLPEDLELAFFVLTREILADAGLAPYEISNFCREGRQCLHNLTYWRNASYVGLGPSAVSRTGTRRFGNARSLQGWRNALLTTAPLVAWEENLTPIERLAETWWLGLRMTRGVAPSEARRNSGFCDSHDPLLSVAESLRSRGLLALREGRFVLTARGLPIADAIARAFFDAAALDRSNDLVPTAVE